MARIGNIQIIENFTTGEKLLRFSTMPVNVGTGSFEVNGERSDTSTGMTTTQRVYDSNGNFPAISSLTPPSSTRAFATTDASGTSRTTSCAPA